MIPPLELRIDNYVSYKGEYMRVFSINHRDAQMCAYSVLLDGVRSKMGIPVTEIDPIPLTPELLLKCGFKNVQGDYYIKDNDLMVVLDSVWWWTNSWEPDGEFGFDALAPYREIEYLHQLQNLFWCLVGKELEVNVT